MPNVECLVKSRMLTAPTALTLRHKEGEVNRLARRLRASLGPRLRFQLRRGLAGAFGVGGRRRLAFLTCSRGPTPARTRSAASRLARAAGACPLSLVPCTMVGPERLCGLTPGA